MTRDLNSQYNAWLEKNTGLFRKWQNAISPPPAQDHPGDFRDEERHPRELKKDKRPYAHQHISGRAELPGEYFSGRKNPLTGKTMNKGLRGPQKGAKYRKQGAKFFEDVEPRAERGLPESTRQAIAQYKITRNPKDYQKIIAEMRRQEPQPKYWEHEAKEIKHPVLNELLRKRLMKALME